MSIRQQRNAQTITHGISSRTQKPPITNQPCESESGSHLREQSDAEGAGQAIIESLAQHVGGSAPRHST